MKDRVTGTGCTWRVPQRQKNIEGEQEVGFFNQEKMTSEFLGGEKKKIHIYVWARSFVRPVFTSEQMVMIQRVWAGVQPRHWGSELSEMESLLKVQVLQLEKADDRKILTNESWMNWPNQVTIVCWWESLHPTQLILKSTKERYESFSSVRFREGNMKKGHISQKLSYPFSENLSCFRAYPEVSVSIGFT
jgi:hypothetical protein